MAMRFVSSVRSADNSRTAKVYYDYCNLEFIVMKTNDEHSQTPSPSFFDTRMEAEDHAKEYCED